MTVVCPTISFAGRVTEDSGAHAFPRRAFACAGEGIRYAFRLSAQLEDPTSSSR